MKTLTSPVWLRCKIPYTVSPKRSICWDAVTWDTTHLSEKTGYLGTGQMTGKWGQILTWWSQYNLLDYNPSDINSDCFSDHIFRRPPCLTLPRLVTTCLQSSEVCAVCLFVQKIYGKYPSVLSNAWRNASLASHPQSCCTSAEFCE